MKPIFVRYTLVFTLLLLLITNNSIAQNRGEQLDFYLITCDVGSDVASAYGHSAIRMIDRAAGTDETYNYGTYNFGEPNFLWKFLRGDLNYCLSVNPTRYFLGNYAYYERSVSQRQFILTNEQKEELATFLERNALPENMYYLYDFVFDNCATRIRDIFEKEGEFYFENKELDLSFRENIALYLEGRDWLKYGTDFLLASSMDKQMDRREEGFLPFKLESNLCEVQNLLTMKPLLGDRESLLIGNAIKKTPFYLTPLFLLTLLFVISLVLFFVYRKAYRVIYYIHCVALGLGGLFVAFMWFGTNHNCTPNNWNLLWVNPLFLLLLVLKKKSLARKIVQYELLFCLCLALLFCLASLGGQCFLPQEINVAAIPTILLVLLSVLDTTLTNRAK